MQLPRPWFTLLSLTALAGGLVLALRWPGLPLLAYWLLVAMTLGLLGALLPWPHGIRHRLSTLTLLFAALIFMTLLTTQLAARRVISSTHLVYEGVHLVGVDSLTVGAGGTADVRLGPAPAGSVPWLVALRRDGGAWQLEALSGIELLRVRNGATRGIEREFSVARSAVLRPGEEVVIRGPDGGVVDTLRLGRGGVELASGGQLPFRPGDAAARPRQQRRLRAGTALSSLEGTRTGRSVVHERFIRLQALSGRASVNGAAPAPLAHLLPGQRRFLVSAAPPYSLEGDAVTGGVLTVADSALVEVRNGDMRWRFVVHAGWRREPAAERGVAIRFMQNPRPLDTPLPAGVSCQPGAACGAISLRRLPPPIAHVALDQAGFDPAAYGLLGVLRVAPGGFDVVLPRQVHTVARGAPRPAAVPVTALTASGGEGGTAAAGGEGATAAAGDDRATAASGAPGVPGPASRWVLLRATGESDDLARVLAIGLGLGLLILSLHAVIGNAIIAGGTRLGPRQERAVAAGLVALLGLVLTRVAVGARVAFFDPFLERGIDTAVGLCAAMAVVVVGLLSWPAWVPALLAGARSFLAGQLSPRLAASRLLRWLAGAVRSVLTARQSFVLLLAASLAVLVWTTGWAPVRGLFTGLVVLLVWVCVAWIAACTGAWFDTFERGAQSVVEQVPPATRASARAGPSTPSWLERVPELSFVLAFLWLVAAQTVPRVSLFASALVLGWTGWTVWQRRQGRAAAPQPDYVAAALGVALFGAVLAVLRLQSETGSLGVFVLVVFVALASVRIGRAVGARLEGRAGRAAPAASRGALAWLGDALLLLTPFGLLAPLAFIDMGLALVLVIPLGLATLLAAGLTAAGSRLVLPAAAVVLLVVLGVQVVFPSMQGIRAADSHAAQAVAFQRMATLGGLRLPLLGTPMDRAAARAVATRDQGAAEALLVAAAPGPARDLLVPSIEQIWGARTYSSAGAFGEGLGRAAVGGRGVAETVSYAENTFAVYVMAEHGAVGGALVLALYAILTLAVGVLVLGSGRGTPSDRASRALFLVAALMIAVPACYVALSNLALVPITGQNMPFLGLNAWSDVAICAGVIGILITGTLRRLEEARP